MTRHVYVFYVMGFIVIGCFYWTVLPWDVFELVYRWRKYGRRNLAFCLKEKFCLKRQNQQKRQRRSNYIYLFIYLRCWPQQLIGNKSNADLCGFTEIYWFIAYTHSPYTDAACTFEPIFQIKSNFVFTFFSTREWHLF